MDFYNLWFLYKLLTKWITYLFISLLVCKIDTWFYRINLSIESRFYGRLRPFMDSQCFAKVNKTDWRWIWDRRLINGRGKTSHYFKPTHEPKGLTSIVKGRKENPSTRVTRHLFVPHTLKTLYEILAHVGGKRERGREGQSTSRLHYYSVEPGIPVPLWWLYRSLIFSLSNLRLLGTAVE